MSHISGFPIAFHNVVGLSESANKNENKCWIKWILLYLYILGNFLKRAWDNVAKDV